MSFSKNNLDKLKSILKKESFKNKFPPQNLDLSKINQTSSSNNDEPEELFYSIIDNSSSLEETTFVSPKLKNSEYNLSKSKLNMKSLDDNILSDLKDLLGILKKSR